MVDVFISYSRKDHDAVAQLAQAVSAAGYDVWWDKELPPHKSYGDVIAEKISEAAATIVVWSQDAVKSEWVRAEADFAREQKKLIQTALGETMPPMPFNQIQYAQLGDWHGEEQHGGWSKVKASLAELCGASHQDLPRPTPLPPPRPAATTSRWPLWAGGGMLALAAALFAVTQYRGPATVSPGVAAPRAHTAPVAAPVQPAPVTAVTPAPLHAAASVGPALRAAPAASATPVVASSPSPAPVASDPVPAAPVKPTQVAAPDIPPTTSTSKAPPQIFPLSSTRTLGPRQLDKLDLEQLQQARNEIFAHAGRLFRDKELVAWFSQYHWYRPQTFEVTLNPFETQNVKLIDAAIEARK